MASINLSSFAGAGAQFFDDNGTPLVGGLLYVYTAGTTTPATTYTSQSGAVNNTNPIVLDAGGRTPNEIWVNGGVLYKFVLKTSTGITIGTYDAIPAIDDPTAFNNIITVTGTNTLIGTSTPPNTAYTRGMTLSFVVVNSNTGAVTLDVDGLGAKEITFGGSIPLSNGQLSPNSIVTIEYDGTRFQLMNSSAGFAANMTSINGGQIAGFRNHIINGGMTVSQRGTSFTAASSYTMDRWDCSHLSSITYTITQSTDVPLNKGFSNSLRYTVITPATGEFFPPSVNQTIEGYNVADLIGNTFTFSFWVRSSKVGTYSVCFLVPVTPNPRYVTTYSVSVADTWEYKTVTVVGGLRASDNPNTTNSEGLSCRFVLKGIPGYETPVVNTWITTDDISATGQVDAFDTAGNIFAITGVQLELGSTATPFEHRLYSTELSLCQRYLPVFGINDSTMGQATNTSLANVSFCFKVPTRVPPTGITVQNIGSFVLTSSTGSTLPVTSALFGTTSINSSILTVGVSSGLTAGNATLFTSTSGSPRILFIGCEL